MSAKGRSPPKRPHVPREYTDAVVLPPGEWYLVVRSTDRVGVLVGRFARVYLKVTAQG
jgi:hypothetical protein